MSTATLERPALAPVSTDARPDHYFCCDKATALCGYVFSDPDEPAHKDCDHDVCELCERVCDIPCGEPDCPRRPRWWQVWK